MKLIPVHAPVAILVLCVSIVTGAEPSDADFTAALERARAAAARDDHTTAIEAYRANPVWPARVASSSASVNGSGSITSRRIRPSEMFSNSSSISRTRWP